MIEFPTESAVVLRPATSADAEAIGRVAQLDTRPLPPGPHLVAERGGRIEAAISLKTGEVVANPFSPTADLRELLRVRAAELAPPRRRATPRGGLRPRPLGAVT